MHFHGIVTLSNFWDRPGPVSPPIVTNGHKSNPFESPTNSIMVSRNGAPYLGGHWASTMLSKCNHTYDMTTFSYFLHEYLYPCLVQL